MFKGEVILTISEDSKDDALENNNSVPKKIVSFKVELVTGATRLAGFIEQLSEDGIYMKTAPTKDVIDFSPGKTFEVKFQPLSGETLCLQCRVKWSYRTPPHGLTNSVGMEIIDPQPTFKEFFKSLE